MLNSTNEWTNNSTHTPLPDIEQKNPTHKTNGERLPLVKEGVTGRELEEDQSQGGNIFFYILVKWVC